MKSELLESWDRQCQIIANIGSLITEENRGAKPSPDGMPLDMQLAHIHEVRYGWLGEVSKVHQAQVGDVLRKVGDEWLPIEDLNEIKRQLDISAKAIRDAVSEFIDKGAQKVGPYDHPIYFLQHMIWHEGYHFALIMLALRLAGEEPSDIWEEKNVWSKWRDEEQW